MSKYYTPKNHRIAPIKRNLYTNATIIFNNLKYLDALAVLSLGCDGYLIQGDWSHRFFLKAIRSPAGIRSDGIRLLSLEKRAFGLTRDTFFLSEYMRWGNAWFEQV